MPAPKPIPEGFHTITPHIIVRDAAKAIEFYKKAFGAQEQCRMSCPETDKIMHAQIKIGDSILMLANEFEEKGCRSPQSIGGTSTTIHLYVQNADRAFEIATKAGATVKMPIADMFWGDRYGVVEDPFGHKWSIATHKKDMTGPEMEKAMKEQFAEMADSKP
jgi:PhnB protein